MGGLYIHMKETVLTSSTVAVAVAAVESTAFCRLRTVVLQYLQLLLKFGLVCLQLVLKLGLVCLPIILKVQYFNQEKNYGNCNYKLEKA